MQLHNRLCHSGDVKLHMLPLGCCCVPGINGDYSAFNKNRGPLSHKGKRWKLVANPGADGLDRSGLMCMYGVSIYNTYRYKLCSFSCLVFVLTILYNIRFFLLKKTNLKMRWELYFIKCWDFLVRK